MLTYRAYRTELRPNRTQEALLQRHCDAARFAYNWGLARRIDEYTRTGRRLTSVDLHRELNRLKKTDLAWLYEVSKCAPHEALRDLDRAFDLFQRARKRRASWPGFPRFKKRKDVLGSFRLNGIIRCADRSIQLPRLGTLRLKERGYLASARGRILSATVTRRAGRWFVSLRVQQEMEPPASTGPAVGVDLGLLRLATTSDGQVFPNPRPFRRLAKKMRRLQRRAARRRSGSRNKRKTQAQVARLHLRISSVRMDRIHKVTSQLARTKSVIVIEDLAVRALQQSHMVSRGLADTGLRTFRTLLTYKATWYGSQLVVAPRMFPSSQICSACAFRHRLLRLGDEMFRCPACGFTCDRDLNAARNLLTVAGSSPETKIACGAGSADQLALVKLPAGKQELGACPENGKVIGLSATLASR